MEETATFNINVIPQIVETPNAIYEYCDQFSVVGANTGPNRMMVHLQFARDVAAAPKDGRELTGETVQITRRVCATLTLPADVATAMANAIIQTIQANQSATLQPEKTGAL